MKTHKSVLIRSLFIGRLAVICRHGNPGTFWDKISSKLIQATPAAHILDPECDGHTYNFIDLPLKDLKEI